MGRHGIFATTRWSLVLSAGAAEAPNARHALEKLCEIYWFPIYVFVRRKGHSPADSEDLTQSFFSELLLPDSKFLSKADPNKGRFRSYVLTALTRFLADEWEKKGAQKRGGKLKILSLNVEDAEQKYLIEPVDNTTPETEFDRQWALSLLDSVVTSLQNEYAERGKSELFDTLKETLTGGSSEQPYAMLASKLGMSESMVKVSVHRLRKRYRELLQEEIANTVDDPDLAGDEMRHLFRVLSR